MENGVDRLSNQLFCWLRGRKRSGSWSSSEEYDDDTTAAPREVLAAAERRSDHNGDEPLGRRRRAAAGAEVAQLSFGYVWGKACVIADMR